MARRTTVERRSTLRAKRVLSIQYRVHKSRRKKIDRSWNVTATNDMSLGGLTFFTDRELYTNDILEIHVAMSGTIDIFKGLCKILRVENKGTGSNYLIAVKFVNTRTYRGRSAKSYRK